MMSHGASFSPRGRAPPKAPRSPEAPFHLSQCQASLGQASPQSHAQGRAQNPQGHAEQRHEEVIPRRASREPIKGGDASGNGRPLNALRPVTRVSGDQPLAKGPITSSEAVVLGFSTTWARKNEQR